MSPPWMPLYIADYRADTAHLNAAEHGAYLLLIMHYWATGSLPDDDRKLARIACMTGRQWHRARPTIQAFFENGWEHRRIKMEFQRLQKVSLQYQIRGHQAAKKRWNIKATPMLEAYVKHCLSNASSIRTTTNKERKNSLTEELVEGQPVDSCGQVAKKRTTEEETEARKRAVENMIGRVAARKRG